MRVEFISVELNVVTYTDRAQIIRENIDSAWLEADEAPDLETKFRRQLPEMSECCFFGLCGRTLLI